MGSYVFINSFLVSGEAASPEMDHIEVRSNPDSEKSKPVAGKVKNI